MKKIVFLFIMITVAVSMDVFAAGSEDNGSENIRPDIREIVNKVDRLYRSSSSDTLVTMTIITPNWKRELKMRMWTKDLSKTFIHILLPKKDRDIATLRIDKSMWNFFPKIDKVIKVPPSMMMSSWMGSDFTNDDPQSLQFFFHTWASVFATIGLY